MSVNNCYLYGYHTVKTILATQAKIVKQLYFLDNRHDERLTELQGMGERAHIPLQRLSRSELALLVGEKARHQGIVADCKILPYFDELALPELLPKDLNQVLLLILDGVQDPHNLGACLRSANAMGVTAVIAPKKRAVGMTDVVYKVASGAASQTPFVQVTNLARTLRNLKDQGIWLVGADADAQQLVNEIDLKGPIAFIMGGEGRGLRRLTQEHCDYLVRIPMQGSVSSLNVSVATGICLYEASRQRL